MTTSRPLDDEAITRPLDDERTSRPLDEEHHHEHQKQPVPVRLFFCGMQKPLDSCFYKADDSAFKLRILKKKLGDEDVF